MKGWKQVFKVAVCCRLFPRAMTKLPSHPDLRQEKMLL